MKAQNSRLLLLIRHILSILRAVSVQTKILGIALILVFFLGIVAILVVRKSMQNVVAHELEIRAMSLAQDLAIRTTDAILVNNLYSLNQIIAETKNNYADIRYIIVVDPTGRLIAHTFGGGFPVGLLGVNGISGGESSRVVVLRTTEGPIWDAAAPIFRGQVGMIRLGLSDILLGSAVQTVTLQLFLATVFVSSLGILLAIFLTRIITKPIEQLALVAHAVGKGDFSMRVQHSANDEIGELTVSFNNMLDELGKAAEANQERERLREELIDRVITAQEDERKRIACDLHDQTSQSLISLIVQLKLIESASDDETRQKNISELRTQLRDALGEVRQMALDLRPSVLDDLGLEQAIRWFADRCAQNDGLRISLSIEKDLDHLPEKHKISIYRVVQEALSNVVKHSHASFAEVKIVETPGYLSIQVVDNGRGFDSNLLNLDKTGLGILGMKERVTLLGGRFEIKSQVGQGTSVYAHFLVN